MNETSDEIKGRRLSRPIGSDQTKDLSWLDFEREIMNRS
jgi:hypothetical protein